MANLLSPFVKKIERYAQPVGTAGNSLLTMLGRESYARTVTAVNYIPTAALSGANTNSRTLNLRKRGADGTGTTVVASLALVSGVDLVDNVPKALTLSVVAGALELLANEVLEWESLAVSSGIVDPGGLVEVSYIRADP